MIDEIAMAMLAKQYMARKKEHHYVSRTENYLEIEVKRKITCIVYFYIALVSNRDKNLVFAK